MKPHPHWINAGVRNVRETTASTAKGFHPGRRRKSWAIRNIDAMWMALIASLIVIYAAT